MHSLRQLREEILTRIIRPGFNSNGSASMNRHVLFLKEKFDLRITLAQPWKNDGNPLGFPSSWGSTRYVIWGMKLGWQEIDSVEGLETLDKLILHKLISLGRGYDFMPSHIICVANLEHEGNEVNETYHCYQLTGSQLRFFRNYTQKAEMALESSQV